MLKHINVGSNSVVSNVDDEMIQPNAIDLRVDSVYRMSNDTFKIDKNNNKTHRGSTPIESVDNKWYLTPGCYEIITNHVVTIPRNECGWVVTRSTFVRNGCFVVSGLYDSGFSGKVGCLLVVMGGDVEIERGTRLGQFVISTAETAELYSGSYGSASTFDQVRYS